MLQSCVARWKAAAVCCLLIWCPAAATAEEGGSAAGSSGDPAAATAAGRVGRDRPPARVEEAQPSLYYLKDKQGNLQAVPNFSFEDFEELYRLKHQLAQGNQRPRYTIQQITASGTADAAEHAELTIQFRILVREESGCGCRCTSTRPCSASNPSTRAPGSNSCTSRARARDTCVDSRSRRASSSKSP